MKNVNRAIARTKILAEARLAQDGIAHWAEMGDYARAASYTAKLEAFVQLLEVDDCGSVGGFDLKRRQPQNMRGLSDRLNWLESLEQTSETQAILRPAADWLDANKQEALSGSLRQIMRTHA